MPWVTEEEIQAAKNMTAYEYLRTHQAQRLQKTRTRNEWQLTDHDSFKINELSSKWHVLSFLLMRQALRLSEIRS